MIYITILNIPRQTLKKKESWTTGSSPAHPFCASEELQHVTICFGEIGEANVHI